MILYMPLLFLLSLYHFQDTTPSNRMCIGIDLGTTNSCIYNFSRKSGKVSNIKVNNQATTSSALTYNGQEIKKDGKTEYRFMPIVGHQAYAYHKKNPLKGTLLYAFKRLIGLSSDDLKNTPSLKNINKKVEYNVVSDSTSKNGKNESTVCMEYRYDGKVVKKVTPVEASAEILKELMRAIKKFALANASRADDENAEDKDEGYESGDNEEESGEKVNKEKEGKVNIDDHIASFVITVPAYFTENQVKATADAAILAGINLTRTMNEPVAAAYAYQMKHPNEAESTKLVFDMGGGTLDISLLEHDEGVLEVKTYSGDNFLGGENVNEHLFDHFMNELKSKYANDKALIEKFTKANTPDRMRLRVFVENFKKSLCTKQNKNPKENAKITREFYVNENEKVKFTLDNEGFNKVCKPVFDKVKHYILNNKEGVLGKYKEMGGKKENISKVLFVGGSSRIPKVREMCAEIFGKDKLSYELDADTCVAEGAAWYAASLAGFLDEDTALCLVDVVSMPVGICVDKDEFTPILEMNSTVPATGSKIFTTAYDNQDRVSIRVAQGLRYGFSDNHYLGEFELQIKEKQPRGGPQIKVTVNMDKDRTLHVTAMDEGTKLEEKVVFNRSIHTLSEEQVKKMKEDKELNEERDNEMRERYAELTKLERYIESVKSRMVGPQVKAENREKIDKAVLSVQSWLKSEKESADKILFMEKYENLKNVVEPMLKGEEEDPQAFDKSQEKEEENYRDDL